MLLPVLCGAVTAVLPVGFLLVPGLFAYGMFRTRPAFLALFAASFLLPALLLYSPLTAGSLTLLLGGSALVLYLFSGWKAGNGYTVLALSGISAACLYAVLCLPGILSGEGAFAPVQRAIDDVLALSRETIDVMVAAGANPETADALREYYDLLSASVPTYLVPVICCGAGVLGLSNLLFFRLFIRKRWAEYGLAPLRPFRLWQIPRSIVYGLFALLAGSLLMEWTDWGYAEGLSATVGAMAAMPLVLQGLCVVDFLLYRTGRNVTGKRVAVYIATGLLFSLLQSSLLILGGFEQLFHLRARMGETPPVRPLPKL